MRSFRLFTLAFLLAIAFNACKSTDSPEAVTEKFMNHLIAGEFTQAKEYGTESTQQMMQMFEALESLGGETFAEDDVTPEQIKNIECDVDGDFAVCRFEEDGETSELNLLKIDGKWLVDMKKENPFGDMDFSEDAEWDLDLEEDLELEEEVEIDTE
jgi:hypothetical protein